MIEKLTGIVIDIVRHNDRHNVVTLFTRSRGRVSFLSPVGKGRSGAMRSARIAPLAWLDAEVNFRPTRSLQMLSGVALHSVWHSLYFEPVKQSLIFFISEFLNRLLRVCAEDAGMFDYITGFLEALDSAGEGVENYHLAFLVGLMTHAGIHPMFDDREKCAWLDMRAGCLCSERPAHSDFLTPEDTALFIRLSDLSLDNSSSLRISGSERSRVLSLLLRYYNTHLPGILPIRSADILREIFS